MRSNLPYVPLIAILLIAVPLIVALGLGWNDPRPPEPADWSAPMLPRRVTARPDTAAVSLLDQRVTDFTFETLARPVAGPDSGFYGYGLVYRAQDQGRYYAFAVGGDGYYGVLRVDGEEEVALIPWQQFPHIRRGFQENRLRLTCAGAVCDLTINDEYAATVEDETSLSGDVGILVIGFDDPVNVEFSSADLWLSED